MTQAEKFTKAQQAVKDFRTKHGNAFLLSGDSSKRVLKLKQQYYALQDAASDAYWTEDMDRAIQSKNAAATCSCCDKRLATQSTEEGSDLCDFCFDYHKGHYAKHDKLVTS